LDWEPIAEAHITFDRLCEKHPKFRCPEDMIDQKIFFRLKEKLVTCKEVIDYVDKFIAHSATPESRAIDDIDSELTAKYIWNAHKTLYEVAEFLSGILFSESQIPLALESPTLFDHWDAPFSDHGDIERLELTFNKYRKETDKWRLEGIEDLWKWIEA
jgi:hypothetical protein